jgi:hypothetical protein
MKKVKGLKPLRPKHEHKCTDPLCFCPIHDKWLMYHADSNTHTCNKEDCKYGEGLEVVLEREIEEWMEGKDS